MVARQGRTLVAASISFLERDACFQVPCFLLEDRNPGKQIYVTLRKERNQGIEVYGTWKKHYDTSMQKGQN